MLVLDGVAENFRRYIIQVASWEIYEGFLIYRYPIYYLCDVYYECVIKYWNESV